MMDFYTKKIKKMRTNNKLNDEDRQVLNGLKLTFCYVITVLITVLAFIELLELFVK